MKNLINIITSANVDLYPNGELNNRLVFAIRGEYKNVNVGDVLDASYSWTDNKRTDNKLTGTSACKIIDANRLGDLDDDDINMLLDTAIKNAKKYGNNILTLVMGIDTGETGNDDWANEVIIDDCTVLALI